MIISQEQQHNNKIINSKQIIILGSYIIILYCKNIKNKKQAVNYADTFFKLISFYKKS